MNNGLKAKVLRTAAVDYLKHFIGLPYLWGLAKIEGYPDIVAGGDDPIAGFDCSGLISEIMQSVGLLPHKIRLTAAALYERFREHSVAKAYGGCLVFWMTNDHITHVEMMIDDFHTVGASGGGSDTTTKESAIRANAFIKMRPLSYRGSIYLAVDPFLGVE